MPEKFQLPLKVLCVLLGMLALIQLSHTITEKNPLDHFTIPATAALLASPPATGPVKKETTNAPTSASVTVSTNRESTNAVSKASATTNVSAATTAGTTNAPDSTNAGPLTVKQPTNGPSVV